MSTSPDSSQASPRRPGGGWRGAGGGPAACPPQEAVERALAAARAGDCIVIAAENSEANLRWAGSTLTTNGVSRSRQLTVIAVSRSGGDRREARVAAVSRSGVAPEAIADLVAEAEAAAAGGPPAADAGPLVTTAQAPAGPQAWDDPPARTEIGVFTGVAAGLGAAFEVAGAAGRTLYGYAEHSMTSTFLGTSAGLRLRHDQPAGTVQLNAKAAGGALSSWAGASTRDFTEVDVAALERQLAQRIGWAQRQSELPAGRYETLLGGSALADLLVYLYWSAGARDAADGRTVFSKAGGGTRIGEQLTGQPLTLRSDPGEPGLECAPFVITAASGRDSSVFDNGLALAPTDWISGGQLTALPQTRHYAAQAGRPAAPEIGNLIAQSDAPAGSLDEMIAATRRGLLLDCLFYIREVDPQTLLLTGLTRDGVYLIENGEVTGAVNNFRFNESPVGMLRRITQAGPTGPALPREWSDSFTRAAMPPVRVEGFNMSSVSQAR